MQQVHISREAMIARLREDVSSRRNDEAANARDAQKAFDSIRSAGILIATDGPNGDRFRISPVIVPLMPMAKLREIQAYLDAAGVQGSSEGGTD